MLGFTIIKNSELKILRNVYDSFGKIISQKDGEVVALRNENSQLKEILAKFCRQRINGKFVKTT